MILIIIALALVLGGSLLFWGGLIWLTVRLLRQKSPFGVICLGLVLSTLGASIALIGFTSLLSDILDSDDTVGLTDTLVPFQLAPETAVSRVESSETLGSGATNAAIADGYVRVELTDMYLKKADVLSGSILDRINFTFTYENVGDLDIRAFTGTAAFFDLFGRPIKSLSLTYDESLAAGKSAVDRDKGFEPNQFIDSDQKLMTAELEDVEFRFEMKSILFADGTRIGEP